MFNSVINANAPEPNRVFEPIFKVQTLHSFIQLTRVSLHQCLQCRGVNQCDITFHAEYIPVVHGML